MASRSLFMWYSSPQRECSPSLELCVIHSVLEPHNLMRFLLSLSARNSLMRMVMWTLMWWHMNVAFFLIFTIRLEPCNIQQVGTECDTLYSLLLCRVSRPLFQFLVQSFSFGPVQIPGVSPSSYSYWFSGAVEGTHLYSYEWMLALYS